ncbi:aldehyde dehydrogenase family protein [Nocardioides daeguensis]|uniref:aldehyde dehydrogenase family protein n=1 Tax=Nocardioides daeguensis TaxID=908359 RepID=UPI001C455A4A|nr:aldehyde dehydrogenase family protein [Nocardioides daeguensis]MBV6725570.1 aldehyde dehydrogenase family protein [Nocardioides daeguensis]MCR1771430.1 aldehyde dehydrogenase family protein [Nocardioides daeguensis]
MPTVVAQLRRVFRTGRTQSLAWRRQQLEGIERFCDEREAEIVAAVAADLGRGPVEAWLGEIAGSRAEASHAKRHLRRWMLPTPRPLPATQLPGWAMTRPEPKGTVLIISPWNYPVFLTLGPLVAAVAAGNTVVVKPSEIAPATSRMLAEWLPRYLDPEAVAVVEGDASVTQELLAQGFDHALFTGGTEIGRKIMAGAAPHLTPVTLELGGKSPVIVDATADLEVTAKRLAWVKLLNSGQTCIAPDYVLAHSDVHDELVDRIGTHLAAFRSGEPAGQPIVNERQFDRLVSAIAATQGRVAHGGGSDPDTLRIEPTVVVGPALDEPLMSEEIFGPVLPVLRVGSLDEAIDFVNDRPKPLATYLFSRSRVARRRIVAEVPAGGTVVNHVAMHCLVPSLPFGGVGPSGMGAYHGHAGFAEFSHRKSVLVKSFRPDPSIIYPPYSDRAVKIIRRLF